MQQEMLPWWNRELGRLKGVGRRTCNSCYKQKYQNSNNDYLKVFKRTVKVAKRKLQLECYESIECTRFTETWQDTCHCLIKSLFFRDIVYRAMRAIDTHTEVKRQSLFSRREKEDTCGRVTLVQQVFCLSRISDSKIRNRLVVTSFDMAQYAYFHDKSTTATFHEVVSTVPLHCRNYPMQSRVRRSVHVFQKSLKETRVGQWACLGVYTYPGDLSSQLFLYESHRNLTLTSLLGRRNDMANANYRLVKLNCLCPEEMQMKNVHFIAFENWYIMKSMKVKSELFKIYKQILPRKRYVVFNPWSFKFNLFRKIFFQNIKLTKKKCLKLDTILFKKFLKPRNKRTCHNAGYGFNYIIKVGVG